MLGAGELDRYITIEVNTPSTHSVTNEPIDSWATLADVWAKVAGAKGSEGTVARSEAVRQRAVFTIYHRTDVTEKNRITYNSKTWDIVSIVEEGYNKYLTIEAEWLQVA